MPGIFQLDNASGKDIKGMVKNNPDCTFSGVLTIISKPKQINVKRGSFSVGDKVALYRGVYYTVVKVTKAKARVCVETFNPVLISRKYLAPTLYSKRDIVTLELE